MLSISSIYIDKEIDAFINRIKTEYSEIKEQEFEIRFSEFGKNSISLDLFNRLIGKCMKQYDIKKEAIIFNQSTVSIHTMKNGALIEEFRKIVDQKQQICQIKNGKEKRDRIYTGQDDKSIYSIRYSSSRETPIECPNAKITKVLERRRNRFEYDTGK